MSTGGIYYLSLSMGQPSDALILEPYDEDGKLHFQHLVRESRGRKRLPGNINYQAASAFYHASLLLAPVLFALTLIVNGNVT